jgi:hypothetical protein
MGAAAPGGGRIRSITQCKRLSRWRNSRSDSLLVEEAYIGPFLRHPACAAARHHARGSAAVAVILAVTTTRFGGDGWESNPPRTPQQRPADGFEDRVFTVRQRPATYAQDQKSPAGIRRRSLRVATVRQNGCHLGCQNPSLRHTVPNPAYVVSSSVPPVLSVLLYSVPQAVVSAGVLPCPPGSANA